MNQIIVSMRREERNAKSPQSPLIQVDLSSFYVVLAAEVTQFLSGVAPSESLSEPHNNAGSESLGSSGILTLPEDIRVKVLLRRALVLNIFRNECTSAGILQCTSPNMLKQLFRNIRRLASTSKDRTRLISTSKMSRVFRLIELEDIP